MYELRDNEVMKADEILNQINNFAINELKKDFKSIGLPIFDVNNISRELKKIEYMYLDSQKEKYLKLFLLSHYQHYNKKINSPLNNFSLNCGKIFTFHFLK